jgi:hypothetical protein
MKRVLVTLALGAMLISTAAFARQDEWVRQVRRQLQNAGAQVFSDRGYELTHQIYTGSLDEGETETVTLSLDVGVEYQIMGACDNDCSDVDLTLYDGAGNEIDQDLQLDDYPIVAVTPRRGGNFRVVVSMADCSAEPCRYGIGVFGR